MHCLCFVPNVTGKCRDSYLSLSSSAVAFCFYFSAMVLIFVFFCSLCVWLFVTSLYSLIFNCYDDSDHKFLICFCFYGNEKVSFFLRKPFSTLIGQSFSAHCWLNTVKWLITPLIDNVVQCASMICLALFFRV